MTQPKAAPAAKRYGYVRVSTADQGRKYSPGAQREAIAHAAARDGVNIDGWYEDHETGTTADRTHFQKLQKAVAEGNVASVYVLCVDRFARDTEDALRISRQFLERGTKLCFVETPADLETPEGRFQFTQYAAFAAFEHARIKARSAKGRERKMATGQPDSWMLPYGLGLKDGFPAAIPDQAAAVRQIYKWRRAGKSYHDIRNLLLKSKWKTARGGAWPASLIRRILSSRAYVGEYHRCGRAWPILDRTGKLIVTVDPVLFDEVQHIHQGLRSSTVGRPTKRRDYLLRGMVWCGINNCGRRALCINSKGRRNEYHHYYLCGGARCQRGQVPARRCTARKNPAERLEQIVWAEIWRLLTNPALLRKLAVALAREAENTRPVQRDPHDELQATRAKEAKILEMIEDGLYTREAGKEKIVTVRNRIASLELEARALAKVVEIAPLDVVERACRQVASGPEPEGYEDRREVLEGLLDLRVVLAGDTAQISGEVPVAGQAAPVQGGKKNCTDRLAGLNNSFEAIPFVLKVKVA